MVQAINKHPNHFPLSNFIVICILVLLLQKYTNNESQQKKVDKKRSKYVFKHIKPHKIMSQNDKTCILSDSNGLQQTKRKPLDFTNPTVSFRIDICRCRGDPTRTGGLYVPNVARYQLRHTPL